MFNFDIKRLKAEADIGSVVNYLGIKVTQKGSANFILCPLPEHQDKHATNCYYKKGDNYLYCSTCGKPIQAIDLIMYHNGVDFKEAADILWEIEGRPDWYKTTASSKKQRFSLSASEGQLIKLSVSPDWIKYLTEKEFKALVKKKCVKTLSDYDKIENTLNRKVFSVEREKINNIIKKAG